MKKLMLLFSLLFIYLICLPQKSTNIQNINFGQIVLDEPIVGLEFVNGHVNFLIKSNAFDFSGDEAIIDIVAKNKNDQIIFSYPNFDLRKTKEFNKPYDEVFAENSILDCVLEEGQIYKIYVQNKYGMKVPTKDPIQFSKFQDMVIDFLLKDKKFGKIINCCISNMDTTANPLFKVRSHIFRETCQKQVAAKTESLTYQLNEKIGALDAYVRKNPFSVLDKADFDKDKDSILAIIRQYEEEIKEIVPVFEYENVELRIDSLEVDIKKYFDLCGILLTPQNSLTIEPSLRGIYSINYQIENHNSIGRKLSLIYLIKIYELINSFANNKENEIQYPKYQRELKKHLNSMQNSLGDLKNGENSKNILSEIDSFKYNNIIDNISNKFDSKNDLRNKLDVCSLIEKFEIASLIYIGYLQLETFLLLNENGHNELSSPEAHKDYKKNILNYNFDNNPNINDFNHFVDSMVYLTTKVRSLFANDISLMVKRSNSGNEIVRKEIDSLIHSCNENEKLFVAKMKDCSDSLLFLWVANVIDNPNDYYNSLLSVKQAIESNKLPSFKYKNSKNNTEANLFKMIYDEMEVLHNKVKDNPLCLQQERKFRKEIYNYNSLYIDSIIYYNNDSVSSRYVGYLVNKLLKIGVLNDDLGAGAGVQCLKCFEYYFAPQDLIPRSFLSEEGFKARIKDFEKKQKEYFKLDTKFKIDKNLTAQSQEFIKSLFKNHPYVFDDYYKNEMESEKKLVYVRYYLKTHPEKCEEILTDSTLIACAANLKQFYSTGNSIGGSPVTNPNLYPKGDEQPGKNNPAQNKDNYQIDEKALASNISNELAPRINFLNLDTYIGGGFYYLESSKKEGWFQPLSFEFATTLNENFDKDERRLKCFQPFFESKLNLYSTRGVSAEFGYGVRFIKPQENYFALSPFLEFQYFNISDLKIQGVKTPQLDVKSFFEGEAGGCFDWNGKNRKQRSDNIISLNRYNLKLKVSHSLSDFHRTYNVISDSITVIDKYWGLTLESSFDLNMIKVNVGIKNYIGNKTMDSQQFVVSNEDNSYLSESFRYRFYVQVLFYLNYLKHGNKKR